jgi:hypothetical protein
VNEEELRALIRHAIQRHLGEGVRSTPSPKSQDPSPNVSISFGQYHLERAADDTMCLIEPAVRCNHCGFCKCHGH